MYEDQETLVLAGDCVHQRPGIRHYLFDYSPDMEYLEIVSPADFKSVDVEPVCAIPPPTPWSQPAAARAAGHAGVRIRRRVRRSRRARPWRRTPTPASRATP